MNWIGNGYPIVCCIGVKYGMSQTRMCVRKCWHGGLVGR